MHEAWQEVAAKGRNDILLVADHASNHVPPDIELGIGADQLLRHIALDIGVEPLAVELCRMLGCPALLGGISRLVIDLNREEDAHNLVPLESDGQSIPGNDIDPVKRRARIDRFWRPYHTRLAELIRNYRPRLLVSLHSFTPRLETAPEQERPWDVGILYNNDDRAARLAIPALEMAGACVGDQLPYSGKLLNATMNLHGEANGIAYLGIEMRQDHISDAAGVSRWASTLAPVIENCSTMLATGLGEPDARA